MRYSDTARAAMPITTRHNLKKMAHVTSYGTYYANNAVYKKKYQKLKRLVKNLVFENSALCDQVANMQENLVIVKEERLFLLRKLCQLQGASENGNLPFIGSQSDTGGGGGGGSKQKTTKKKNAVDVNSKAPAKRKATKRVVQLIPLDNHGRPIFPITLGDLTVYSLGEVVFDRTAYHTEDVIYPVGFCSTRTYASLKDAQTKSLYTCKILDGGVKPRFEIVSDSDLDHPIVGCSLDDCHARLLTAISPLLCNIPPKGASFFGISHPTIQNLIQSSPGTRKLALYKTLRFEVSKGQIDSSPIVPSEEEEQDPGINFLALHRSFPPLAAPTNFHQIKEEPASSEHDFRVLQEFI